MRYGKCSFRGPGRKQRNKTSKEGKTNSKDLKSKETQEPRRREKQKDKEAEKQRGKQAQKRKANKQRKKRDTRKQRREDAIQDKSEQKLHNAILKWKYSKQIPSQINQMILSHPYSPRINFNIMKPDPEVQPEATKKREALQSWSWKPPIFPSVAQPAKTGVIPIWVCLKMVYTPNEIAISKRDNDQQNHWV